MWKHNVQQGCPERIYIDEDEDYEEPEPQYINTSKLMKVEASKDRLSMRYSCKWTTFNEDAGLLQANREVPHHRAVYYFEAKILDAGLKGCITIGFSESGYSVAHQLGDDPGSYGYRGVDGRKYCGNSGSSSKGEDYGPSFGTGDVVGAGIVLETQEIFFTKNGKHLGVAFNSRFIRSFFPSVSLRSKDESMKVNFGQAPFEFDVEGLVEELRSVQKAHIQCEHVPANASHSLVRSFLEHYGYADTLRAYDSASGMAEMPTAPAPPGDPTLDVRKSVRDALMEGDVPRATNLINTHCPQALAPDPLVAIDVPFYLSCLHFIELMRRLSKLTDGNAIEKLLAEILAFMRETLAPMRVRTMENDLVEAYGRMLHDVVALLAFQNPLASDLGDLLSIAQREAVADAINAAILARAHGAPHGLRPQAPLERVFQQLKHVTRRLHIGNGGFGEPFRLRNHLPDPDGPKPCDTS